MKVEITFGDNELIGYGGDVYEFMLMLARQLKGMEDEGIVASEYYRQTAKTVKSLPVGHGVSWDDPVLT